MCYFRKFHKVVRCDLPENSFFFAEVSYFEQIRMLEGDLAESIGRAIWFRASHFGTDQLLFENPSCPSMREQGRSKVDHVAIARGQA